MAASFFEGINDAFKGDFYESENQIFNKSVFMT